MAKKIVEKKKELWEIAEMLDTLQKAGMEVYGIQEMKRQYEVGYDYELTWMVFIRKEKISVIDGIK